MVARRRLRAESPRTERAFTGLRVGQHNPSRATCLKPN
jgi:hypothetical protein